MATNLTKKLFNNLKLKIYKKNSTTMKITGFSMFTEWKIIGFENIVNYRPT
jgi:hypothetical protein